RDDIGLRHVVEELPVFLILLGELRLQYFHPVALFDQVFLRYADDFERVLQLLEQTPDQLSATSCLLGYPPLKRAEPLHGRCELDVKRLDTHKLFPSPFGYCKSLARRRPLPVRARLLSIP